MEKTNKRKSGVNITDIKQTTDNVDINSGSKQSNAKKSPLFVNSNRSETEENLNNEEIRVMEKSDSGKTEDPKRKKQMKNIDRQ